MSVCLCLKVSKEQLEEGCVLFATLRKIPYSQHINHLVFVEDGTAFASAEFFGVCREKFSALSCFEDCMIAGHLDAVRKLKNAEGWIVNWDKVHPIEPVDVDMTGEFTLLFP